MGRDEAHDEDGLVSALRQACLALAGTRRGESPLEGLLEAVLDVAGAVRGAVLVRSRRPLATASRGRLLGPAPWADGLPLLARHALHSGERALGGIRVDERTAPVACFPLGAADSPVAAVLWLERAPGRSWLDLATLRRIEVLTEVLAATLQASLPEDDEALPAFEVAPAPAPERSSARAPERAPESGSRRVQRFDPARLETVTQLLLVAHTPAPDGGHTAREDEPRGERRKTRPLTLGTLFSGECTTLPGHLED